MIALSPVVASLKLAIKSLNPALMLPAGIALEAIGFALENSVKNIVPFASGGIVTGPVLGLVGEAGPEVISPLNKLKDFIEMPGEQDIHITITGELSGDKLLLLHDRAVRKRRRTF